MNITIRPAHPEDAEALLSIYAPYVRDTAVSFEYEVPTPEEFAERIHRTLAQYPYLVAEERGVILGYAYAGVFKSRPAYGWAVETSIYVDRSRRQQGLGRLLYTALEKALAAQGVLNANACITWTEQEDDPYLTQDSARFHARLGYQKVAQFHQCGYKFGRWYDMIWMEKHLAPHRTDQPLVVPFDPTKHL